MKLSTRGQYATRALLDLALHQNEEPVLLKNDPAIPLEACSFKSH